MNLRAFPLQTHFPGSLRTGILGKALFGTEAASQLDSKVAGPGSTARGSSPPALLPQLVGGPPGSPPQRTARGRSCAGKRFHKQILVHFCVRLRASAP